MVFLLGDDAEAHVRRWLSEVVVLFARDKARKP
jgi:hypothetical protein